VCYNQRGNRLLDSYGLVHYNVRPDAEVRLQVQPPMAQPIKKWLKDSEWTEGHEAASRRNIMGLYVAKGTKQIKRSRLSHFSDDPDSDPDDNDIAASEYCDYVAKETKQIKRSSVALSESRLTIEAKGYGDNYEGHDSYHHLSNDPDSDPDVNDIASEYCDIHENSDPPLAEQFNQKEADLKVLYGRGVHMYEKQFSKFESSKQQDATHTGTRRPYQKQVGDVTGLGYL